MTEEPPTAPTKQLTSMAAVDSPEQGRGVLRSAYLALLVLTWVGIAGIGLLQGWEYYVLPLQDRAFAAQHDLFKPAGSVGHLLGIVGSAMILVGVLMYSIRKRLALLASSGKLKYWLELHIFLCTLGPFLVLLHTSFRFGGIVSIAFWSMVIVVASGVFGRYVYARIPKTINGRFLSMQAVEEERDRLGNRVAEVLKLTPEETSRLLHAPPLPRPKGFLHAIAVAARSDAAKRRHVRRVRRLLRERRVPRRTLDALVVLIRNRFQLEQQAVLLTPFQRLFRYWHILHLPLAIVMLLIVIAHVAVAVLFGYA